MPKFVRVRDKETGHEFSISELAAQDADHLTVLNEDAERNGVPLPATPKTSATKKAASGS